MLLCTCIVGCYTPRSLCVIIFEFYSKHTRHAPPRGFLFRLRVGRESIIATIRLNECARGYSVRAKMLRRKWAFENMEMYSPWDGPALVFRRPALPERDSPLGRPLQATLGPFRPAEILICVVFLRGRLDIKYTHRSRLLLIRSLKHQIKKNDLIQINSIYFLTHSWYIQLNKACS